MSELLGKQAAGGDPQLLHEAVAVLASAMTATEVAAQAGVASGERGPERITWRNGQRPRRRDTHAGSIELRVPALPNPPCPSRGAAPRALLSVAQPAYLEGVSTSRVDDVVRLSGGEQA